MNSNQAVVRMRQIEKMIEFFKDQRSRSIKTNLGNLGVIKEGKEEASKIYEEHVGCLKYERNLSPDCQEVKQIWNRISSPNLNKESQDGS